MVGYRDYAGREAKVRVLSALPTISKSAGLIEALIIPLSCICGTTAPHLLAWDVRFPGALAL